MPETSDADLVLHYAPRTRSFTVLWLLEELGRPYRLASFDINTGHHKDPEYLAINPMGKVPAVVDRGVPVTETDGSPDTYAWNASGSRTANAGSPSPTWSRCVESGQASGSLTS